MTLRTHQITLTILTSAAPPRKCLLQLLNFSYSSVHQQIPLTTLTSILHRSSTPVPPPINPLTTLTTTNTEQSIPVQPQIPLTTLTTYFADQSLLFLPPS